MSTNWSEKQSADLLGKLFSLKYMGYTLLMIDASEDRNQVFLEYILQRENQTESVEAEFSCNSIIPSVAEVFPQGVQMQAEIASRFPVTFHTGEPKGDRLGCSIIEWGPFHPLLPQPVKFRIWMKDEVIEGSDIETGYNYRGLEELCTGRKPEDVLELLERTSAMNGFPLGFAFARAIEQIHEIQVPERAQWLRMFLMEMTFLHAGLQSLNHTARSLGLMACSARIFKLSALYQEAAALISNSPQFSGLVEFGGLSRDITRETLFAVNAVVQEMEAELQDIRRQWDSTPSITKRLHGSGKTDPKHAGMMTGRLRRAAGLQEDLRSMSSLPWSKLSYTLPQSNGGDCFARAMLMLDDILLSLDLIDQITGDLPKGSIKTLCRADGSGDVLVCEPEACGGMAVRVRQNRGRLAAIRIRNAAALNISFLEGCLRGMEMNDLPLIVSSFELDLSAMEK
jgi:ech hydrogenase subunit E